MVSLLPINRVRGFPLDALSEVRRELDRFLDGLDRDGGWPAGVGSGWLPAMDVVETDDEIRCTIEVPGVARDDLEVSIQGRRLRIAGEKRSERTEGNGAAHRLFERRYGRFERHLTLPDRVDASRVTARHEDGILTIVLPKSEEARPRQVPIEAGSGVRRIEGEGRS